MQLSKYQPLDDDRLDEKIQEIEQRLEFPLQKSESKSLMARKPFTSKAQNNF